MLLLLISSLFVLTQFTAQNNIDPLLEKYVKEFKSDLIKSQTADEYIMQRLNSVEIIVVKEKDNERSDIRMIFEDSIDSSGVCNIDLNLIFIRESFLKKMDDFQRKMLVYHELGHCILGKKHDDSLLFIEEYPDKKSIMNSYGISKYNDFLYKIQLQNFFDIDTYYQLKSSLD